MSDQIIHINEHKYCNSLTVEELVAILKQPNKLIDSVDIANSRFQSGYFIGLSWLADTGKILYVTPKLDSSSQQIDFLRMLSEGLKHPEIVKHGDNLYKIEFDKPTIKIKQKQDIITPLIIVYFLQVVQNIVRKGLKKGYYKVEKNLYGKVKGKILISETVKQNVLNNKKLNTVCTYDEFGLNHSENRMIKKALLFVRRYLKMSYENNDELDAVLNYVLPAFKEVDENIGINDVKSARFNPFYSEYTKAIDLAIVILKRFGFNINFIMKNEEIEVPPFWINMPLIFELYVLSKLKHTIGSREIIFQSNANYGNLDFLRITKGKETVIDAKYKPEYKHESYIIEDIRQLSAYARDKGTLRKIGLPSSKLGNTVLECLIIYPDQTAEDNLTEDKLLSNSINQFEKFYKIGIAIPENKSL